MNTKMSEYLDILGYYAMDNDRNLFQFKWGERVNDDEFFIYHKHVGWVEENKDDYEIVHIAHFSLDLFSESFMEELRLMIMEEKDCKDYMCNNCGGGFTKEEMFFDDSNDHDVCTPCFVATEQYKDAEFPNIDKTMANASGWKSDRLDG